MTTALVATVAMLATLAAVGLVVAALARARLAAATDVARALEQLDARVAALAEELEVTRAHRPDERSPERIFAAFGTSLDLDEVLARTLEALEALPGVDAGLVAVGRGKEPPLVAAFGLSPEEAERYAAAAPPDGGRARAIAMSYAYENGEPAGGAVRAGVAVPLPGQAAEPSFLAAFTRSPVRKFDERDIRAIEALAARAAPALENARRFREARELADLDALTGLHNRRYFHETLEREVSRAQRYGRKLALVVFDLDDLKAVNDRLGHLAGDAVIAEAAQRLRSGVRAADLACRVGGDEFAVILPESAAGDADQLFRRVQDELSSQPVAQAGPLSFSAGAAELRPDEDAVSLFQRADEALYRAKAAGKARVVAAGG